jgi:ribonuclease T1
VLRTRRPLLALLVLLALLAGGYLLSAVRPDRGGADRVGGRPAATADVTSGTTGTPAVAAPGDARLPTVGGGTLPPEARRTLRLIERGGPFPHERDGADFANAERLLPVRARGWYREYTVPTPGEADRGARRIVAGRDGTRYYTADHYATFALIVGEG